MKCIDIEVDNEVVPSYRREAVHWISEIVVYFSKLVGMQLYRASSAELVLQERRTYYPKNP